MYAWEMCLRIAGDTQKSLHRTHARGGLRGWVEMHVGEGDGVRCVCRERGGAEQCGKQGPRRIQRLGQQSAP
jgi:hypothetical protein